VNLIGPLTSRLVLGAALLPKSVHSGYNALAAFPPTTSMSIDRLDPGPGAAEPTRVAPVKTLRRGTRAYRLASVALFLAGFATFAALYCVQPLLPIFAKQFDISPTESSLALSVSTGFLAFAIFLAAPVSELLGRRGLMFASMSAAALCNLAAAVSPSWHLLIMLRGAEGIALGGVPAVAMAYLAEEMDASGLGFAMGLYVAGTAFGGMAGRVITGAVAQALSWRWALSCIGISGLLAAAGFYLWLPPSQNFSPQKDFDSRFHVRAWFAHLSQPALLLLFAIAFVSMGSFVAAYNFIGFRLTAAPYWLNQTQLGLIFTVYLFGIGASSLAGLITDKIDRRVVLPIATLVTALGVATTLAHQLPIIVLGIALLTSGFFVVHSVASAWVGQLARGAKGHASSLYLLAYYIGSSAMGSAAGWFYAQGGWSRLVQFVIGLLALGLVASVLLYRIVAPRIRLLDTLQR
jgi:YNFM family putative membrane transporter